jgi:hypothetical protein
MKKYITFLLIAFISFSCSDDFVEVEPPFTVDSENFFLSEEDYNNGLIAIYDLLQSNYASVMLAEIASDDINVGGESPTDVIGWQQIDRMIHTPINQQLRDVWNFNYAGVYRATFMIENQDNIDFTSKNQILAEARFLRAFFNFNLVRFFGEIPIKPEGRFELGEELALPRSSVEDVYQYIENDLLFAVENMSTSSLEPWRANQFSAKALLGKVYLYRENFGGAAAELADVINSGSFHLYGTQDNENYANLFEFVAENSPESVFEIQYTGALGASFDCLQCSTGNVMVGFSGVRGYDGPTFEPGFGFILPREDVYNAFSENDLRRDVSILNIEEWAAENSADFNIGNQDEVTGHTGFYNRKYIPRIAENEPDANLTQPNNYRAIRYADVLLMAAEALVRGGGNGDLARNYVNEVRNRAGLDNIETAGNQLLEDIYTERRLELVGEGHRFFDLVRTGRAANRIEGFTANKNEVFPIPLEELQFSQGNWEQNEGY